MAKIQLASEEVRREYRASLRQPGQCAAFDRLVRLLTDPRDSLAWHHEVGRLVGQFRPEDPRGTRWSRKLADALGPSPELLEKSLRFAELYHTTEDFQELEGMGVNWTRLYFAFVIKDPEARHALLREAVNEGWSDKDLRLTIQQRYPSNRRGVGGRRRRAVQSHGPEVALREMERQSRAWAESHAGSWEAVKEKEWARLVRQWPAGDRARLRQLLKATAAAVKEVGKACAEVRRTVARLLRQTAPEP
jgi:hypothetical protein